MTNRDVSFNWLIIAFQQPTTRLSEIFYFDKRDNQFFSILVTDYFLFDDKLNLAKDTSSSYSDKSLKILEDRIRRIDRGDSNILAIPRHGKINEVQIEREIIFFLKTNNIELKDVTIWEPESGNITINISD